MCIVQVELQDARLTGMNLTAYLPSLDKAMAEDAYHLR